MSVDDWARREAERRYPADAKGLISAVQIERREARADGITHAFDALLSDEAVEAAARSAAHRAVAAPRPWESLTDYGRQQFLKAARADLQAAINVVTKEARND